jgi:tetratricopeptide (TPR) repeat protein
VLHFLGRSAARLDVYGEAQQLFEESWAIRQALGDKYGVARCLDWLGNIVRCLGQLEESERLLREGIAIFREIGSRESVAAGMTDLGFTLICRGEFVESLSVLKKAVAIHDELGLRFPLVVSTHYLALAEQHLGRYGRARARARACLILAREYAASWVNVHLSLVLAEVAMAAEEHDRAHQLMEETVSVYRDAGFRSALGLVLCSLGNAVLGLGQLAKAQAHLHEALQIATQIGRFELHLNVLSSVALLLANAGEAERAVELYALASRYPFVANSRWFEDVIGKHIAAAAASLPPDAVAAAQARGRARDLWDTAAELLAELGE